MHFLIVVRCCTCLFATATVDRAQIIAYGAGQTISGDTDVINTGINVDAIAFVNGSGGGTSVGPTVNGLNFTNFMADSSQGYTTGNFTVSPIGDQHHTGNYYAGSSTGLTSAYATLLDGGLRNYGLQPNKPAGFYGDELTFTNLNVGDTYQVELFANASSGLKFVQDTTDTTVVNSGATLTFATLQAQGGTTIWASSLRGRLPPHRPLQTSICYRQAQMAGVIHLFSMPLP